MKGQASKGCEKEEESNKESSARQRLASLFFFHLSIIKGIKVDFLLLFLRQLPYLSGIEQFYIDTNPGKTGHITMVPSHHPHMGLVLPIHHVSVADMFKRSRSKNSPVSHPLQYIYAPFFHDHHPPMTDHFLSTLAHYPRSWFRNNPFNTLKLACLNGNFLTSSDRFTSMAFDQKILHGVRCQVPYSHHVNCTVVPWGSSSLLVIPLVPVNNLHD